MSPDAQNKRFVDFLWQTKRLVATAGRAISTGRWLTPEFSRRRIEQAYAQPRLFDERPASNIQQEQLL
jgi:hypothetical protein